MKRTILIIAFLGIIIIVKAQQIPIISQQYINQFLSNPAYAGEKEYSNLFLHYREQWADIPEAPKTAIFTLDGAVKPKKIGLGFSYLSDNSNIINHTRVLGTYRYRINIGDSHYVSLGLAGGLQQNAIQFDKIIVENPGDPGLFNSLEKGTGIDANFGILYGIKKFRIGISGNHLLNNGIKFENELTDNTLIYKLIRHYMLSAKYRFNLKSDMLYCEPFMFLRSVQGLPVQIEAGAVINWKDQFWFAGTFRQNSGIVISAGLLAYKKYTFGYAFDIPLGEIADYTSGSHELVIGYRFIGEKKSKLKSSEQKIDVASIRNLSQQQSEEIDKLTSKNDLNQKAITELKEEIERLKAFRPPEDNREFEDFITKHKVSLDDIDLEIDTQKIETLSEVTGASEYYVIVGAYYKLEHTKLLQQILKRELNLSTRVFQRQDSKYFFVYTTGFDNKEEIKKELERLEKMQITKYVSGQP